MVGHTRILKESNTGYTSSTPAYCAEIAGAAPIRRLRFWPKISVSASVGALLLSVNCKGGGGEHW